jgi:hypothetical protein
MSTDSSQTKSVRAVKVTVRFRVAASWRRRATKDWSRSSEATYEAESDPVVRIATAPAPIKATTATTMRTSKSENPD